MKLTILNFKKILYKGYIVSLIAPGFNGYFQILKNHTLFISILKNGYIKYHNQKKEFKIKIDKGLLKVEKNFIIILL
ncbi:FoF1 ATP synthase subunit delta/epsilon [Blattabacterium cuenoti]|uniref:FoF1 ATP synthase subunit delta/epsilon n=1 Tax=Blattabacterium cuenoti TaxID=1653831 RepID=UPI00163D172F|nr:F0F1 ATP synthase subunit epsilon [Blattabacterium cuenoti]